MSKKVDFTKFDPFSVFKYHATFWRESDRKVKKIVVAGLVVETILVLTARYFLNITSNLILPNRVSHYKDSAVIVTIIYIALTAIAGFRVRTYRKIEKAELITKLLLETQSKKTQVYNDLLEKDSFFRSNMNVIIFILLTRENRALYSRELQTLS